MKRTSRTANVKPPSPLATSESAGIHVWRGGNKTATCRAPIALGHTDSPQYWTMHTNGDPPSRQRMRPWLESRINSGEIPGLEWVNEEQMVFKVRWKHVGNREWTMSDGQIFKEWAVHTGKFREGVDTADYPSWKTRFRCALTKLPDIEELRDLNRLDGQALEPYRVYKFLPRRRRDSPRSEDFLQDMSNTHDTSGQTNGMVIMCPAESTIPTTVDPNFKSATFCTDGMMDMERLDSDLKNIPSGDLLPGRCEEIGMYDMDIPDMLMPRGDDDMQIQIAHKANKSYFDQPIVTEPGLFIHIRYRTETKVQALYESPSVCRIFHSLQIDLGQGHEVNETMFGPAHAKQIYLPVCQSSNSRANDLTAKLLNVMDRGVVFSMQNGSITANRLCRCSIFVSSPSLDGGATKKLTRGEKIVVYNYGYFQQALEIYMKDGCNGPKPVTEIMVGFGQRVENNELLSNLLMSATVTHAGAHAELLKVMSTIPLLPPIEISMSNDYDKYLDQVKQQMKGLAIQEQPQVMM